MAWGNSQRTPINASSSHLRFAATDSVAIRLAASGLYSRSAVCILEESTLRSSRISLLALLRSFTLLLTRPLSERRGRTPAPRPPDLPAHLPHDGGTAPLVGSRRAPADGLPPQGATHGAGGCPQEPA